MMLRIAFTLEQSWHRVPGGTAVAALETLRALEKRGRVGLVGVTAHHRRPPSAAWDPRVWAPTVPVRALPLPRRLLYECWHTIRYPPVERATGGVDVIHATGIAVPPPSAPLVYTLHDLAFRHEPSWFTANGRRFFERALELALRRADMVVCPSEATRRDCVAAGFAAERVRVIPLGTEPVPVGPDRVGRVRAAYGLNRPYVLWTGSVEPRKNLRRLVEAFTRLGRNDLDLVLVGPDGWGAETGSLLASAAGRIRPLGFVPRHELAALYAGAQLFCYPSLLEGFGLPVAEAMAQGTPVVTSAGTATEEVVGGGGLVVDPTDVGAIAAAMNTVLEDPDLAQGLGSEGERLAAARFTWDRVADRLEAVYEEVAGRVRGPRQEGRDPRQKGRDPRQKGIDE